MPSAIAKKDAEVEEVKTENQKLKEEVARLRKELEEKQKQVGLERLEQLRFLYIGTQILNSGSSL